MKNVVLVVCLCAFFLLFVLFLYVRFLCKKKWQSPSNLIYITSDVTIYRHEVILKIFWRCHVSPVKFSYWSKFHVNIITGSRVTTFCFIRNWPDISDIGNTLVWVLHNIWRLGQVGGIKFGANVSSKKLLNAAKFQDHSFCSFWIIKGKPTGEKWKITPHAHPD